MSAHLVVPDHTADAPIRRLPAFGVSPQRSASSDSRWSFVGRSSLPGDPVARREEQRGRRWLMLSYVFCPCHVPIVMAAVGAAFGGTTWGASVAGNGLPVGGALVVLYAVVVWRGFHHIRRAKRIEADGGTVACGSDGCVVFPASRI